MAGVEARVCPTAMERAGAPWRLQKRLGRALHPAAKTLVMWSERLSEIEDLSLSDVKRREDYIISVFAA